MLMCLNGIWTGGGSHPASLEHGPELAHVCLQSSRAVVMSQAFGGLPASLMTRREFTCLRTWDSGCCEHSLVSASVETCHLDQDWTFGWYIALLSVSIWWAFTVCNSCAPSGTSLFFFSHTCFCALTLPALSWYAFGALFPNSCF